MNGGVRSVRGQWLDGERRPSHVSPFEHDKRLVDADGVLADSA